MSYSCQVLDSVDSLDLSLWRQVCSDPTDLLMDVRFLRSVENSAPMEAVFRYLMFLDADNRPVACGCVSVFSLDVALFVHPVFASVIRFVRKLFSGYVRFKVVMCGLPVSTGESHLRVLEGVDAAELARTLDDELRRLAKEQRARLIVTKEFTDTESVWADSIIDCGYLRAPSVPMNTFDHPFSNMDEFEKTLRSHYRYKIRKSREKFEAADVQVERLTDPADIVPLYRDEVHAMYERLAETAEHRLEVLPRAFFIELAQNCFPHVVFTVLRQNATIVGFAWSLKCGTTYRNLFIGFNAEASKQSDAYFNLMLMDIDNGLRSGANIICLGQTADTFKSRLGCYPEPRTIYVRAFPQWMHWCMVRGARWIFSPFDADQERDLFRKEAVKTVQRGRSGIGT